MKASEAIAVAPSKPSAAKPLLRPAVKDCAGKSGTGCGQCQRCKRGKLAGIQAKANVPAGADAFEGEADRAADRVLGMATPPPAGPSGAAAAFTPHGHGDSAVTAHAMPPSVEQVVRSSGQPLPASSLRYFEPRFGHDFGRIRIHADAAAAASARAIDAQAYTLGHHIVFDHGRFDPANNEGRRLLAHELAHTIQQRVAPALPEAGNRHAPVRAPGPWPVRPYLARKGNAPAKREPMVVIAPDGAQSDNDAPWLVYAQEGSGATRRRKLPGGTRVDAIGAPRTDLRTDGGGKPERVTLRQVQVLSIPSGDGASADLVGRTGMLSARFLAPASAPAQAPTTTQQPRTSTSPVRVGAPELDARRKAELLKIATSVAAARAQRQQAQMSATIGHLQVARGAFGNVGGGGSIQVAAQAAGEPVKEKALAVADALSELEAMIERDPLLAFASGLLDGVRQNLDVSVFARNADTFAKFAVYWHLQPSLQAGFFEGTVAGVRKEIEGLVDLLSDLGAVVDQLVELAKAICSEGGAEVTRALGQQIGADWAKRMTEIGGMTDLAKLARSLGETFGPLLIEIAIGFATGGSSLAASASAKMASLIAKFPKLQAFFSKLRAMRKLAPGKPGHRPDAGGHRKPHAPGTDANPPKAPPAAADASPPGPSSRKPFPEEEARGLRHLSKDPKNVRNVTDKSLLAEGYEIEIPSGGHTYRRKSDGTWCRFSVKSCGHAMDEETDARLVAAAARREKAIAAGWAIEDYVTRLGYQRPKAFNFPGIDGWKGGKGRGGRGTPTVVGADVIQIKGVSSMKHTAINAAYEKGVAGLLKDSFEGKEVRLVNPKSRTLHILFDQDTYTRLGIRQQDEIRSLIRTLNALKQDPPIGVVWRYFAHGRPFRIDP